METWQVIAATVLSTTVSIKFLDFLFSVGRTDERDELIDVLQVLSAELQVKHERTKLRMRDLQQKYIDCTRSKIDLQLKYDELTAEKENL